MSVRSHSCGKCRHYQPHPVMCKLGVGQCALNGLLTTSKADPCQDYCMNASQDDQGAGHAKSFQS